MKMKKLLLGLMFLISLPALADSSKISVIRIGNSCAPWDGHAIAFNFKDDTVPGKSINISIWKWNPTFPFQTKFKFNPRTDIGNMNVCAIKDGKPVCVLESGSITLNSAYKAFKVGDIVEGDVEIENPDHLNFHFKYQVPEEKHTTPILCG